MKTSVLAVGSGIKSLGTDLHRSGNYDVTMADAVVAGFAVIHHRMPHVILLGDNLPDVDYLVTIQLIRQLPGGNLTKIIVVSTLVEASSEAGAQAAGADNYMKLAGGIAELGDILDPV